MYCICVIKKASKFFMSFKLLPEKDRGNWQSGQCSGIIMWLQILQYFRSRSGANKYSNGRESGSRKVKIVPPIKWKKLRIYVRRARTSFEEVKEEILYILWQSKKLPNLNIFKAFVIKIVVWIRIQIGRSGFRNSLDPDFAKYLDSHSMNPDPKQWL